MFSFTHMRSCHDHCRATDTVEYKGENSTKTLKEPQKHQNLKKSHFTNDYDIAAI